MWWLPAAVGALLLVAVLVDVFETVFHPEGHGGLIHRLQNRTVWTLFRRLGVGRDGTPRDRLLARAGPLMAPLSLVVWSGLLIAGFALVYYPWLDTFLVSPGHLRVRWVEAFYYSAYIATSVGNGDMVADLPALRFLTGVEGVAGLALVSVAVSYLINIYTHQAVGDALAMKIRVILDEREQHLLALTEPQHVDSVARQLENVVDLLTEMLQAYAQYPILHYFRPSDRSESLPVQMGELLYLLRSLEGSALGSHPSLVPLQRVVMRYLTEVHEHLVPRGFEADRRDAHGKHSEEEYDRVLRYLRYR